MQFDPNQKDSIYDSFRMQVLSKFDDRLTRIDASLATLSKLRDALQGREERAETEEQVALVLYNTPSLPLERYRRAIENLQKECSYLWLKEQYCLGIFAATNGKVEDKIQDFKTAKMNWPQGAFGTEEPAGFRDPAQARVPFPTANQAQRRYVFLVSDGCRPPKSPESWPGIAAVDAVMIQTVSFLDYGIIEGWERFCRANNGEFVLVRKLGQNVSTPSAISRAPAASGEASGTAPGTAQPSPRKTANPAVVPLDDNTTAALALRLERLIAPRLHLAPMKRP
jgi:hypothetical protein